MSNRSKYKQNKSKKKKPVIAVDIETQPITGRHYDMIVMDDMAINADHPLLGGPIATNAQPNAQLSAKMIHDTMNYFVSHWLTSRSAWFIVPPGYKNLFDFLDDRKKWSKEEMAKQVELYRNVIETKFGVKLCVKNNHDSAMTSMELLVPNELFADDKGRESLADALQNIAMFIMSMDTPSD